MLANSVLLWRNWWTDKWTYVHKVYIHMWEHLTPSHPRCMTCYLFVHMCLFVINCVVMLQLNFSTRLKSFYCFRNLGNDGNLWRWCSKQYGYMHDFCINLAIFLSIYLFIYPAIVNTNIFIYFLGSPIHIHASVQ